MSLGEIGGVAGVVLGVLAYIQYLRSKLMSERAEKASLKTKVEEKEWKTIIDRVSKKVTESEKDYNEARDDFRSKHPADGGDTKG